MTDRLNLPDRLPADWYGADLTHYVGVDHDVHAGDALLIATDRENLTPGAEDLGESTNTAIPVGSMLYALRVNPSGQSVRCGYHKDYYEQIPSDQGLIWGKIAIRMRPCTANEVVMGDLIVRKAMRPSEGTLVGNGPRVGIVVERTGRVVHVLPYIASQSVGAMVRASSPVVWDLYDPDLTRELRRAATWTRGKHPLTEREDTTVSTDTPTVNETANTAAVPDTLCKDPAHEAIVAQLQEKDAAITRLRTDLAQARREHQEDINVISDGFWDEAERRDWCEEARDAIETINSGLHRQLSIREYTWDVQVRVYGTTQVDVTDNGLAVSAEVTWMADGTVQVDAYNAEDAQEKVEEDDSYVVDMLSSFEFTIENVDSAEVDDEHTLIMHLEAEVDGFQINTHEVQSVGQA